MALLSIALRTAWSQLALLRGGHVLLIRPQHLHFRQVQIPFPPFTEGRNFFPTVALHQVFQEIRLDDGFLLLPQLSLERMTFPALDFAASSGAARRKVCPSSITLNSTYKESERRIIPIALPSSLL